VNRTELHSSGIGVSRHHESNSQRFTMPGTGDGKPKKGVARESHQTTRKMRRSASDAFGEDSDASGESPLRKKQNMSSYSSPAEVIVENKKNSEDRRNITASFTTNQFQTPAGYSARESDSWEEEEEESMLHIEPNIKSIPTNPIPLTAPTRTTTAAKINSSTTEKSIETLNTIRSPQKTNYNRLESRDTDHIYVNIDPKTARDSVEGRSRIGLLCFACWVVLSVATWTGLLLNERSAYQLELSTCRERVVQMHHAMGLSQKSDDTEDLFDGNNVNNRLKEQLFYWKELESQVLYWKKEAKIQQQYVEGVKQQCQESLQHLATEVLKETSSERSEK